MSTAVQAHPLQHNRSIGRRLVAVTGAIVLLLIGLITLLIIGAEVGPVGLVTGLVLATGFKPVFGGSLPILVAGRSTLREVASFGQEQFYWDVAAQAGAIYLVGQLSSSNTPQILRRSGATFVAEPIDGDVPLFGVTVDPAGTAWAVGPAFGGAFGLVSAGLWRRTG